MEKGRYIPEMQIARGIGIFLVTLGHSLPLDTVFPTVFKVIYAFHMPFFFFLSGFFSIRLVKVGSFREWTRVVPGRLADLAIPYVMVSLSYALIKYLVPSFVLRPVDPAELPLDILLFPSRNPALFLWFLYTIIMIQAITAILARVNTYVMGAVLVALQLVRPHIEFLGLGLVAYYAMYCYLGMKAFTVQEQFLAAMKKRWVPVAALFVFVAAFLVRERNGFEFMGFFTALSGTAFVLSLCFSYTKYLPARPLEILGAYSFSLYLLQFYFIFPVYYLMNHAGLQGELIVPFTFLAGTLGPLLLIFYVFPRSRTLSFLFSGLTRKAAAKDADGRR